ncbi:FkbM family methyltransferase [Flammeovirga kamogawensis]|uniref:FkbM family methyltransferase n=1 Tax=Flammeovirga kamogawensis TaxID=373891 RepID=A0ABX8GW65_9BACT|nr:FkbM family methyltransferase [Flammeovirga kamogawensis]MBB6461220.1 FkbM family methyltransferase [Flammeovirga kamogawensis]QWG07781.1 FkbM family methyltransferase [Flammeovirga kamogawensis]
MTTSFFRGAFTLGWYEKQERLYIPKYLNKSDTVLELGGCIGVISCIINNQLEDKTKQVTVEANPKLIQHLIVNKERNNCKFEIVNKAVSNQEQLEFNIGSSIVLGSANVETNEKVLVDGITPSQIQDKYNLKFNTLVMDIEGGELFILRDFKKFIGGLDKVLLEVHPFENILTADEVNECEDILSSLGFKKDIDIDFFQAWIK